MPLFWYSRRVARIASLIRITLMAHTTHREIIRMIMRGGARRARSFRLCSLFLSLPAHNASHQLLFEKSQGNNFCSSVAQSSSFIIIRTRAVIISDVRSLIVANFCFSPRVKDRARSTYMSVWPGGWPSGWVVKGAGEAGGGYAPSPPAANSCSLQSFSPASEGGIYHKICTC